jgi:hypothetical protein
MLMSSRHLMLLSRKKLVVHQRSKRVSSIHAHPVVCNDTISALFLHAVGDDNGNQQHQQTPSQSAGAAAVQRQDELIAAATAAAATAAAAFHSDNHVPYGEGNPVTPSPPPNSNGYHGHRNGAPPPCEAYSGNNSNNGYPGGNNGNPPAHQPSGYQPPQDQQRYSCQQYQTGNGYPGNGAWGSPADNGNGYPASKANFYNGQTPG